MSAPPDTEAAAILDDADAVERAESGTFAKPAPRSPMAALTWREAERREDDPPPEVPRDQWERPIIVLPDGTGVISYVRASKYGKLIRNQRALIKWDERNIVWGMSRGHHLVARASGVRTLTAGPDISVLEDIAEQAKTIAGAHAGAMTGSGMHALHARRIAGEDLSWLDPTIMLCLDAITDLLDPRIFEVVLTEGDDDLGRTFVVHDDLQSAGSFDLVVRLLRDLTWPDGVTIRAGTILVVDLKTGKITSAPYWDTEFTCQQLTYAEGWPYRPGITHVANPKVRSVKNITSVTDQPGENGRITWQEIGVPGRPDQRYSLILHVPAQSPADAHWERVDLDEAREDAQAAKGAHARARVERSGRFLALPTAALVVPGVDLPAPPADSEVSTGNETKVNPRLQAILAERIYRADSTDTIDQLYDSWGKSPSWSDALTDACQAAYDRLTPPADPAACDRCNYDKHDCPGCGIGVPHGKDVCRRCELRLLLSDAPDQETLIVMWEAHAPADATELGAGDGLWDEGEHTPVAQRRDEELIARELAEARPRATYPVTIPAEGDWPEVTLWCHECLLPPGHPQADDPIAWCDCDPQDTCMDSGRACRNRAHSPVECAHYVPDEPNGPDGMAVDDANPTGRPAQDNPGPGPADPDAEPDQPEPSQDETPETDAARVFPGPDDDPAGPPVDTAASAPDDQPGPFDSTMDLSDLRDKIEQALDTDTLDELYDAHCPVAEGGDGLWTDDLNAVAQARYDELAAGTGAAS
jgi:hypothetical protein